MVYGTYPDSGADGLVFVLERQAQELRELSHALHAALTWADFWTLIPEVAEEELRENLEWADLELPDDATPFDPMLLPGYDDGEYPQYAPAYGSAWMPQEIERRYGVGLESAHSGSWSEYPASHEADVVVELRKLGYTVRRDDALVAEACGH